MFFVPLHVMSHVYDIFSAGEHYGRVLRFGKPTWLVVSVIGWLLFSDSSGHEELDGDGREL